MMHFRTAPRQPGIAVRTHPFHFGRVSTGAYIWLASYGVIAARSLIGWFRPAHLLISDSAVVGGISFGLYGVAVILERRAWGAIRLGTGAGIAFLSKGLLGPGVIGLTALALAGLPHWQTRRYVRALTW